MNKYDYARTTFALQGLRVFSVLLAAWVTLFIVLTAINLFTHEWDYPAFLLLVLPPIYLISFFIWKYATRAIKKAKKEQKQLLTTPTKPRNHKTQVAIIQIAIGLLIALVIGNFLLNSKPRDQTSTPQKDFGVQR